MRAKPTAKAEARVIERVPANVWIAAGIALALRALPFLCVRFATAPAGHAYLPIGYNPKDWLAYAALTNPAHLHGGFLSANPFTTEAQDGRFVLLFHALLGLVRSVSGIDPFALLELVRIPLVFVFTWILWRSLAPLLPDRGARSAACWLALLAGGLECLVWPALEWIPAPIAGAIRQELWHLQGWNGFASLYNPLWIAALALTLLALRPLFLSSGEIGRGTCARLALVFTALFFTHPYSAVVVLAAYCAHPIVRWIFGLAVDRTHVARTSAALALALAGIALVSLWQRSDPVFARSSSGVFGPQALSIAWYPITLGVVGVLALRGVQARIRAHDALLPALGAWIFAVVGLHSSTLLNGYHYVFHLFVPLSVLAAPVFASVWARGVLQRAALVGACFASPLFVTYISIADAREESLAPIESLAVVEALRQAPPGNVLAPPGLGNLIPALTPHRVYVGQWFLTPGYREKCEEYAALANDPKNNLRDLALREHLRYVVLPRARTEAARAALGDLATDARSFDQLVLFTLRAQ